MKFKTEQECINHYLSEANERLINKINENDIDTWYNSHGFCIREKGQKFALTLKIYRKMKTGFKY